MGVSGKALCECESRNNPRMAKGLESERHLCEAKTLMAEADPQARGCFVGITLFRMLRVQGLG